MTTEVMRMVTATPNHYISDSDMDPVRREAQGLIQARLVEQAREEQLANTIREMSRYGASAGALSEASGYTIEHIEKILSIR
jgi:hypothetical protein